MCSSEVQLHELLCYKSVKSPLALKSFANIFEHTTLLNTQPEIFKDKLMHNNTLDLLQEGKQP